MLTIEKLEVQFDVEGGEEEAMFRRLFNRNMQEWRARDAEERRLRRMIERDRGLGDRADTEES
ncbi:MAG: hypothetical protein KZQ88_07430 [Candidatus Thiodiazotropha sp. (ex Dulcina madagascariensis)]|nr:hypothetical protein [Candidatus Thiodiazotropha sp. (ex Epidulcina cf. delphinae)]MCU7922515.1 hypothetical protein [Candidatus Thiodiazotropha sp. (ex Dulcina madagascariensis)]MCU7925859.1 hypothetical protein [Candidatus Thiodiazotropha sp. (ex Dulcina madagascariensis)]